MQTSHNRITQTILRHCWKHATSTAAVSEFAHISKTVNYIGCLTLFSVVQILSEQLISFLFTTCYPQRTLILSLLFPKIQRESIAWLKSAGGESPLLPQMYVNTIVFVLVKSSFLLLENKEIKWMLQTAVLYFNYIKSF